MSDVGQVERETQDRVVELLRDELGFDYLGNWQHREGNSNIETELLEANLRARGYGAIQIGKAIEKLRRDASLGGGRDLYEANRASTNCCAMESRSNPVPATLPRPSG